MLFLQDNNTNQHDQKFSFCPLVSYLVRILKNLRVWNRAIFGIESKGESKGDIQRAVILC